MAVYILWQIYEKLSNAARNLRIINRKGIKRLNPNQVMIKSLYVVPDWFLVRVLIVKI